MKNPDPFGRDDPQKAGSPQSLYRQQMDTLARLSEQPPRPCTIECTDPDAHQWGHSRECIKYQPPAQ